MCGGGILHIMRPWPGYTQQILSCLTVPPGPHVILLKNILVPVPRHPCVIHLKNIIVPVPPGPSVIHLKNMIVLVPPCPSVIHLKILLCPCTRAHVSYI